MNPLYRLAIGRRLFLAFGATTVIALVAISLLSVFYFRALVARDQAVKTAFAAQQVANDQQVSLQRMNALLRTRLAQVFATQGTLLEGDPSLGASGALIATDILTREADFEQSLTLYQQQYALAAAPGMEGVRAIVFSDDPASGIAAAQMAALTTVITRDWPTYRALQDQVLQLLDPSTNPALVSHPFQAYEQSYATLFEANTRFLTLSGDWQQVVNSSTTIGEIVTNVGPSQYDPVLLSTSLALCATVLMVVLAGYMVDRTITRPLRQLATLTRRIERGENAVRALVRGRDEIALVAQSLNSMLDTIVGLIQHSESARARLQFQVEKLMHDVRGISQGDLRVRVDPLPDLGELAGAFNFMLTAFSSLIRDVKLVAYQVVSSTAQIAHAMSHLEQSAEQQIVVFQSTSREIERMANTSKQAARKAQEVSVVATRAHESARQGSLAVQRMVKGVSEMSQRMRQTAHKVHRLAENSSAITGISAIMETLAQKMQRLALDAAIQVEMGGGEEKYERQAGFAQVVREIRALADQAKTEAATIKSLAATMINGITEVQQEVMASARETETLTVLATQTGEALGTTFLAVERQAEEIQEITQVIEAYGRLSEEIVQEMQRLLEVTRQNSRVLTQTSYLVQSQGELVGQLQSSVEAFKVAEGNAHSLPESRRPAVRVRNSGRLRGE